MKALRSERERDRKRSIWLVWDTAPAGNQWTLVADVGVVRTSAGIPADTRSRSLEKEDICEIERVDVQ
jgi:hypothetical protein